MTAVLSKYRLCVHNSDSLKNLVMEDHRSKADKMWHMNLDNTTSPPPRAHSRDNSAYELKKERHCPIPFTGNVESSSRNMG